MTETKWTPGPWYFGKMYGWSGICVTRRQPSEYGPQGTIGDAPIASVIDKAAHWENSYPVDANAALIAAAPDLYEALADIMENEKFHTMIGGNPIAVEALMTRAYAALAKARGET